jgi:hypothetical protein
MRSFFMGNQYLIDALLQMHEVQKDFILRQRRRIEELEEGMKGTEALRNRRGILRLVTNKAKAGQNMAGK